MGFWSDRNGHFAMIFALALPAFTALGGMAIDYSLWVGQKSNIRAAADAAAVAAARNLAVGVPTRTQLQAIAAAMVDANILVPKGFGGRHWTTVELIENETAVAVTVTQDKASYFSASVGIRPGTLSVRSVARLYGGTKICVATLSPTSPEALVFGSGAKLIGEDCGIYVNSENSAGVVAGRNVSVQASILCAAGGIRGGASLGRDDTQIVTDCAPLPDPFALRDASHPTLPGCWTPPAPGNGIRHVTRSNGQLISVVYESGDHILQGGARICGDVIVTGTARMTLQPEQTYFFGNKLEVSGNAELIGTNASLLFHSRDSFFEFKDSAKIELSARATGPTAGMLIWQSRTVRGGGANLCVHPMHYGANLCSPNGQLRFKITADQARKLVGVVYLPNGSLYAASSQPIADQSAWTAIVTAEFELREGPTIVLNTNYRATNVPVPPMISNNRATAQVYIEK